VTDNLEKAALEAVTSAADRLGVDAFRLARFLANGRIADFLQALGRAKALEVEKLETTALADRYHEFVLQEKTVRGQEHGGAMNGG
jgi:hypothetical protein